MKRAQGYTSSTGKGPPCQTNQALSGCRKVSHEGQFLHRLPARPGGVGLVFSSAVGSTSALERSEDRRPRSDRSLGAQTVSALRTPVLRDAAAGRTTWTVLDCEQQGGGR